MRVLGSHLVAELDRIAAMALPELRAFWAARWGDPPGYRARDHLLRALAYRLQAEAHGGLSSRCWQACAKLSPFSTERPIWSSR